MIDHAAYLLAQRLADSEFDDLLATPLLNPHQIHLDPEAKRELLDAYQDELRVLTLTAREAGRVKFDLAHVRAAQGRGSKIGHELGPGKRKGHAHLLRPGNPCQEVVVINRFSEDGKCTATIVRIEEGEDRELDEKKRTLGAWAVDICDRVRTDVLRCASAQR